ncbi:hypothetical protein GEV33_003277 [Tenebrio molitor]|uniref:Uncharacterized protein n=1 Tax=Tenebrio molitor TaxID=7067 RepID=A0A8J6HRR5_TENMO|nr:hypothetical protein GEV33_003277 [Tenebrio molitor]
MQPLPSEIFLSLVRSASKWSRISCESRCMRKEAPRRLELDGWIVPPLGYFLCLVPHLTHVISSPPEYCSPGVPHEGESRDSVFGWCWLLESLDDKRRKTEDDLKEIVEALDSIVREKTDLNKLKLEVESFYVFDADLVKTEQVLRQLRNRVESRSRHAKDLSSTLKDKYNKAQQLVPSDVAQELNQLELLTEAIASAMDEKDREFKKARTIRTDYLNDVEDVQSWIKDAELKVQDRSVEPQLLQEHLQQIQSEIGRR